MSFWDEVSKFIGTDRSDSFIGHIGEVLATDKTAQAAALAVAAYYGLPYVPGGSELAAYASEMAGAAEAGVVGAGGLTADAALASAGATAADLGVAAGTAGTTAAMGGGFGAGAAAGGNAAALTAAGMSGTAAAGAGAGAAAMTPAALESLIGTAGYGTSAAAGAGSGAGAYLNTLGATTAGAAGAGAAATPWYLSPAALQTGAGLVGGLIQNASQRQAASMQSDAAQRAIDLQADINKQQMALNAPFYSAGVTGQNRLMDLLGLGTNKTAADYGKYAKDFSMADYQADPGYAFRLSEGMKQLAGNARAKGGAVSGRTMMGAQDYAQGLASQEYGNAFNRYQTNRANQLQPLANLQNVGISAANQQSSALGNYGSNVGNLLGQQGQAQAAGALGQGNTMNAAIGSGISAYQNNALVDQLRRLNPSTYGNP